PVRRITILTLLVCGLSLTAHWAFNFWFIQHLQNHDDLRGWGEVDKANIKSLALGLVMVCSITGNFAAAVLARWFRYRKAICILCAGYFVHITATYSPPPPHDRLWFGFVAVGLSQGVFALFTMYLPPLFPTLLRTTGAGFCYNFGRVAAGFGTV